MTCWEEVPNREEHHTKNTPISSKVGREHREEPGITQVRMDADAATQGLHFSHTPYTHTLARTLFPQGALRVQPVVHRNFLICAFP